MTFFILLLLLIFAIFWGFVARAIASTRGMEGGFWWGFFLGIIGVIVVAVRPNDTAKYSNNYTENNTSSIGYNYNTTPTISTETPKGEWTCTCGRVNSNYTRLCNCGKTKQEVEQEIEQLKNNATITENSKEVFNANAIKEYKNLLDEGIISQEEFDAKKKQLLGI